MVNGSIFTVTYLCYELENIKVTLPQEKENIEINTQN